jgi:hypothetical protein
MNDIIKFPPGLSLETIKARCLSSEGPGMICVYDPEQRLGAVWRDLVGFWTMFFPIEQQDFARAVNAMSVADNVDAVTEAAIAKMMH